jgi:hypothetical protein
MRILISNNSLSRRAGTEMVVWELAQAFRARGHEVAAYSSELGEMAGLIRESHVAVINDPRTCPFNPDIIHGQHHLDAISALLSLPDTPAIFHSHGGLPWVERAPLHPRILHYVGMCPIVTETIGLELGIVPERLHTILNWVDLKRFHTVRTPPDVPRRALVFTRMMEQGFFLDQVMAAFHKAGIALDLAPSLGSGGLPNPESILPQYDIVLAAGRSALEAIACGCATMIVNHQSSLGLVTPKNFKLLREQNMSPLRMSPQLSVESVARQIAEYDAASVALTTQTLRQCASLDQAADQLLKLYQISIDEWKTRPRPSPAEEMDATSQYLRFLTPGLKSLDEKSRKIDRLESKLESLQKEMAGLQKLSKAATRSTEMLKRLRKSTLGRLALHFAKRDNGEAVARAND